MAAAELELLPATAACGAGCACEVPARPAGVTAERERSLRHWAGWLTALTIGWNSLEALIALVSGLLAGSVALVGFGLDSLIEVSSAVVIAGRLVRRGRDHHTEARSERRAVRLIALSFFAIAAYLVFDAAAKLLGLSESPDRSPLGLALVALSLVVMPALAWAKRRVAATLGSVALTADAAQTQLCTYLSGVVLLGLAANALVSWWWMDPLAGLVVAALAAREGRAAWTSGKLCAC